MDTIPRDRMVEGDPTERAEILKQLAPMAGTRLEPLGQELHALAVNGP